MSDSMISSNLKAARQAVEAGHNATFRGRAGIAYEMFDAAADGFARCSKNIKDEGAKSFFAEMAASYTELADVQRAISLFVVEESKSEAASRASQERSKGAMDGGSTPKQPDASSDSQQLDEATIQLKRLQRKVKLLENQSKLLFNQQLLLLGIASNLANGKEQYKRELHGLRQMVFDMVTEPPSDKSEQDDDDDEEEDGGVATAAKDGNGADATAKGREQHPKKGDRAPDSRARIDRLRTILAKRRKDGQSVSDIAAGLLQSHFVKREDLESYQHELQQFWSSPISRRGNFDPGDTATS
ncbi:hypothetical protein PTSG_01020 [Salpingoeca rosetta]|uniref:Uncharacterized protein n=1 Tax=Salpingoeca rosetta (strain ATCC 50818 / BSB-021) TaxID=946362 RepID=F2TY59_SALR5|nr:uncharacterized protein PTSG_01020 [Salpingoeca rosetta]EGD76318.1 hypothetical protein PTSG_01020 [Salpingoeca rosetta]|eukprot:XP_004998493.1 hypothetical protein PTSG_01020 [Salpingoeca rosetta]